ncbi:hypothetical protein PINS_up019530 [Pythium insidiosum]|nr:hypothetical protein PINS_up019530 [Pythium insidiosum]
MAQQRLAFENRELLCGDASSAICNFGEKNDDVVRIGGDDRASLSSEFYGDTHVADASAVFIFVVVREGSVAAGTQRMQAVVRASGNVLPLGGSIVVSANALQPLLPTSTSYSASAASPSS